MCTPVSFTKISLFTYFLIQSLKKLTWHQCYEIPFKGLIDRYFG